MEKYKKFIFLMVMVTLLLPGCVSNTSLSPLGGDRDPGMTVDVLGAPEIDLMSVFGDDKDDLLDGIVIGEIENAGSPGDKQLINAKLIDALRKIPTFTVKSGEVRKVNLNKPKIKAEVVKFEIEADEIRQGSVFRRGVAQIKFSLVTAQKDVITSVMELYERTWQRKLGGVLPSTEKIKDRMATEVCGKFVERIVYTGKKQYRKYKKGNMKVNSGIEAASVGNLDGALAIWENELQKHPNNHAAAYNMGIILESKGDDEKAEKKYQYAVGLRGDDENYARAHNEIKAKIANKEQTTFIYSRADN